MIATRETFKKYERLCSRKLITILFDKGNIFYTCHFKVIWAKTDINSLSPARVAFMVPKKSIRDAVSRNLLKRRMKEAYRKNKNILYDFLNSQNITIAIIVIFRKDKVEKYATLEAGIRDILGKIIKDAGNDIIKSNAPSTIY